METNKIAKQRLSKFCLMAVKSSWDAYDPLEVKKYLRNNFFGIYIPAEVKSLSMQVFSELIHKSTFKSGKIKNYAIAHLTRSQPLNTKSVPCHRIPNLFSAIFHYTWQNKVNLKITLPNILISCTIFGHTSQILFRLHISPKTKSINNLFYLNQ